MIWDNLGWGSVCLSLALCVLSCGLCRHISPSAVKRLWLTAPGRQQKTGAGHVWLADGSADLLRAWEATGAGGLCCSATQWSHPSFGGFCLFTIYLTVSLLRPPVSISGIITFSHGLLGMSSLSCSCLLFLLPCGCRDLSLVHSWPLNLPVLAPLTDSQYSLRMGRGRRIIVPFSQSSSREGMCSSPCRSKIGRGKKMVPFCWNQRWGQRVAFYIPSSLYPWFYTDSRPDKDMWGFLPSAFHFLFPFLTVLRVSCFSLIEC